MSLKRRITFLISILLIMMILISIKAIYTQSSRMLNEDAELRMTAQLSRANENVSLLFKSIVLETEKLSLEQAVKDYFTGEITQVESDVYLTDLMAQMNTIRPVYMDLFLVNHNGIIVSAAMAEAVGVDVNGRQYYKHAVDYKMTNTSDIILSRADQTQIVITLTPTYDRAGNVLGYTGIAIFATYFSDFLSDFEGTDEEKYIIVDSYDKIVSHPNKDMISKQFDNFGLGNIEAVQGEDNYVLTQIDNTENIVMERHLDFNNWRIVSYLESDKIYRKSRNLSYTMFNIGVVFVLIAVGMGIYITDLVAKPLVEITETINKIIEEEISFKHTMLSQLPFERLEGDKNTSMAQNEPAEISNFRKAMLGFKDVFERGAKKFDLENKKLKTYIDTMYEELDEINKRNLDFISTLSHDIRTPLTLIKGYARGLESGEVIDREMESKFKSGIVRSANDLENLIYNVLDFAYEVGDPGVLSKQTMDVKEAIDEIVFEVSQFYKGESRKIDYKIDAFSAERVQGQGRVCIDLMNLNRVLINLINNSLKYSHPTDKVMLIIQNWRTSIHFEVYDSGQGIQTEEIEKITDIFYRTEASKNQKGYGLGLYISKQILQGHDIQLKIESQYGKYTKLSFEVPIIRK